MPVNKCRSCGSDFFAAPLLIQKNMPDRAQHLPDINEIEKDRGVDLAIYQCQGCGLVQLGNDPVSYYKDVIRAASISKEVKDFRRRQSVSKYHPPFS